MFYVAYTAEGADPKTRPVTFVFNGGPGSSSLWLHMGSFGPDAGRDARRRSRRRRRPTAIVDNADRLLDRTDLVFVDAMGTGLLAHRRQGRGQGLLRHRRRTSRRSRQFIERWRQRATTAGTRPSSCSASPTARRAARRCSRTSQRRGHGVQRRRLRLLVPERLGRLQRAALLERPRLRALPADDGRDGLVPQEARRRSRRTSRRSSPRCAQFALGDYAQALGAGQPARRRRRATRSRRSSTRYTGLPRGVHPRREPAHRPEPVREGAAARRTAHGRPARRALPGHRPRRRRRDSRIRRGRRAFAAAFAAAFNAYVRETLGYKTDELYKPTNYEEVGKDWDDRHRTDGRPRRRCPTSPRTCARPCRMNPNLRIFSANG